jgi:integrase
MFTLGAPGKTSMQRLGQSHQEHLFTWARKHREPAIRSLLATNPASNISKQAEYNARDRVLSYDEIKRLWAAADMVGWPGARIIQLLLLTGQRVNEVAHMRCRNSTLPTGFGTCPASGL